MNVLVKTEKFLFRLVDIVTKIMLPIGSVILALMILLLFSNIIGRMFFDYAILGTIEIVEIMMVTVVFFAIPYTTIKRNHVIVDTFTRKMPIKVQTVLAIISSLISLASVVIISYEGVIGAVYYAQHLGDATGSLRIPYFPFRLIFALGMILICLIIFLQMFHPDVKQNEEQTK